MAHKDHKDSERMQALRKMALRYPEAEEGIACAGTAAEKRTIKARNKAFVFLGRANVMVKLLDSLSEASALALASQDSSRCKVGAHGWVTVSWGDDESPPVELLSRWIDESYRLLAPKLLVASLPAVSHSAVAATAPGKKKAAKRKAAKRKAARQ